MTTETSHLSEMAQRIFTDLYSFSDETINDTFKRVSKEFGNEDDAKRAFELMKKNIWRPNTPVFFNAGGVKKIFAACWVVGLEDSMDGIYDISNVARKIFQSGAGIGIPIGNLREKDGSIYEGQDKDEKTTPTGKSSGPISFMSLYDAVGATTKSGGRARRAAIMMVMPVSHPDIMEYIECKKTDGVLSNMNISVSIPDDFMRAFKDNIPYHLISPSNGVVKEINARQLWDKLVDMAHKTADPGVLFIDTINKFNPLKKIVKIECTNPSLRAGTKVITDGGIYPIEQLENKHFLVINQKGEYSPAECFLSGKDKELYEITLVGGKKYYSTAEHKWPVLNDNIYEKRLTTELKSGDYLPIVKMNSLGYGMKGNYDDGFIIGWNLGDGWITDRKDNGKRQYGFIFSNEDIENGIYDRVMRKITSITNKVFNPSKIDGCIEFNTTNENLDIFFRSYGVGKKSEGLPSSVWTNTSDEFRRGLIDGLFSSDGYISKIGNRGVFCSSNYKLASDVSELLGFYGIKTRLTESISHDASFPNKKSYGRTYTRYFVTMFTSALMHFRTIFTLSNHRKNELLWIKKSLNKGGMVYDNIRIKSVIKTDIKEDVWDIRVYDETHTFKLSHVITGNCGEQPLIPFTSCNLSSINVHKFCNKGEFQFDELYDVAYTVTKLMDNLVDNMDFPDERFKVNVLKYRPIGVGIMGLSDALFEMDLPYDSKEGQQFAENIMKTVTTACIEASADLAKEKGKFADYDIVKDDVMEIVSQYIDDAVVLEKVKKHGLRNCQHTTIAPTGSIALSCDCSYGMEPAFGLVFQKTLVESGDTYTMINPIFKRKYENETWYTSDLIDKIVQNNGSLKGIRGVPKEVRDVFVVAHDIKPKDRIDMQSVLQKHVSTAISSTTNLPNTATRDEVSELYRYAYQKGLKGITIYRDGCKKDQPISFSNKEKTEVVSNFTRPSKLQANVHIIETGNGKMYVTVSTHNGRAIEIFLSMGKSGQLFNTFTEALGRTVSIALQHGVPIDAIIKTLEGINSDRPTWFRFEETDKKPSQILSIPDAISQLLKRYYVENKTEQVTEISGELCPKCGKYSMAMIEGCSTCTACGESKCG